MKLFILAAGTGSRLMPLTRSTPKSLLDLGNGTCLLDRQMELAIALPQVDEVDVVTGYRSGQLEERLRDYREAITTRSVFNPFFTTTNNLISLWCLNTLMFDDDFAVTNGDNLYDPDCVASLLQPDLPDGIFLTVSRKNGYDEDDMKVQFGEQGNVRHVSKEIPAAEADAESVGLAFVRGARMRTLFAETLVDLVRDSAFHQRFWLEAINRLAHNGVYIKCLEIPATAWNEFDFHPDMETIRAELSRRMKEAVLS